MPLPTTATGPTNVYFVTDDTGTTAGPAGSPGGGGSGAQVTVEFTATSIANAFTTAHILATALQRPLRLVPKYTGNPPWTLVQGVSAATAITAAPSGTGY